MQIQIARSMNRVNSEKFSILEFLASIVIFETKITKNQISRHIWFLCFFLKILILNPSITKAIFRVKIKNDENLEIHRFQRQ